MNDEQLQLGKALAALDAARKQIKKLSYLEPIAIVGLGCRFPGGANSPEIFWDLLQKGFDASIEIPNTRWNIDDYYNADPHAVGTMISRNSCLLDGPIDEFDPLFFGISPREADYLDPQQRLLLEVTWEALEQANINPRELVDSRTGVFIGISTHDYGDLLNKKLQTNNIEAYFATGTSASTAAGRISYTLGLKGPSIAIDTACSSSLVALHQGCVSLRQGESDLIITGGVNLLLSPLLNINFSRSHMLAPDGHCKTFDKNADGYVRGEGCGIVVLKRLSDAQRDHNTIWAVIKGSAVNQDGNSSGLTVPNGVAQKELIETALQQANLQPDDIDYIEAHGTGTSLGDPIEINALYRVFGVDQEKNKRENPLLVATVKTNIGHLEAAAGIAGIIKTVLSLHHQQIPQHLHYHEPNPTAIDFKLIPLEIPTQSIEWKKQNNHIRRAGVSGFGFSGTNAHVILEEAPVQEELKLQPRLTKTVFNRQRYWAACLENNNNENSSQLKQPFNDIPSIIPQDENSLLSYDNILDLVREHVLGVLSLPLNEKTYDEAGFFKLGMDSLMVVELKLRLARLFPNVNLSSTAAYDYPTIVGLSHYIEAQLSGKKTTNEIIVNSAHQEPIAIIGLGCRFPAGANTPQQFWELLAQGFDAGVDIPLSRWDMNAYYSDDREKSGKIYTKRAGLLNVPIEEFDANFFGISAREATLLDPQQRLLLEVTWEGLENAKINPHSLHNSLTGVFIGIYSTDYRDVLTHYAGPESIESYAATGTACSTASGRLSYILGLKGPNFAIDTACSSSLVAVHQACLSLRQSECDLAIAGGVNVILSPDAMVLECSMQMLSPEGRCKTFDKDADGFMRGEGCGIVILKRLSDAQRDSDDIIAVIKGSAINQDGASSGLTVPNGPAQEEVIRRALAQAQLNPDDIDYIEAHGTGTPVGDPIEINAIEHVFSTEQTNNQRENPLVIGTVKTNIGHAEAASGIAGLIKTILALQHEMIPAHLHFKELNPALNNLSSIPAILPLQEMIWEKTMQRVRRAGISSFAFSGTNAHVILEEAPLQTRNPLRPAITPTEFKRERYWIDNLTRKRNLAGLPREIHPLLGARLPETANRSEIVFEKTLSIDDSSCAYLAHHKIFDQPIFPATGYIELFLAALIASNERASGVYSIELKNITIDLPFLLQPNQTTLLQTILSTNSQGQQQIMVYGKTHDSSWQLYSKGEITWGSSFLTDTVSLAELKKRSEKSIDMSYFYQALLNQGLDYGKSFKLIRELYKGNGIILAKVDHLDLIESSYYAYPPLLDSILQTVGCLFIDEESIVTQSNAQYVYLPVGFGHMTFYQKMISPCYVAIEFEEIGKIIRPDSITVDLLVFDDIGVVIAKIEGFALRLTTRATIEKGIGEAFSPDNLCYISTWQRYELLINPQTDNNLIKNTIVYYDARNKDSDPIAVSGAVQLVEFLQKHAQSKEVNCSIHIITEEAYSVQGESVILNQAMLTGFIKTAILECPALTIRHIDMAIGDDIEQLIDELAGIAIDEQLVAHRGSDWYVARIMRETQQHVILHQLTIPNAPYRLIKNSAGLLDEMKLIQENTTLLPGHDEIILAPKAIGLNFRDVLNAMNLYPGDPGPLGADCAGIVTAIGKNVTEFQVGDEVMGVALGALSSLTSAHSDLLIKKPVFLDFTQAASIPTIFLTAYYSLVYLAKLKKGDRILIHAGCGGVGLAAIQIAKWCEADIFATAGSEKKRAYLSQLGIKHVLDSRSLQYGDEIAAITNHQGVNVVLNSLTGAGFIETSLGCCAKEACFIEISKRDIWSAADVQCKYTGIRYHIVAIDDMMATQSNDMRKLLQEIIRLFENHQLYPIEQRVFPLSASIQAFQYLRQAQHIGKVVIVLPPENMQCDPRATYLITGGLGGIGLELATYLSDKQAGRIVLTSRNAATPAAIKHIDALRSNGGQIIVHQSDISDREQVKQLIAVCHTNAFPLKGIFHAAGIIEDALMDEQNESHIEHVFAPKAKGAWYLHEITKELKLDCFVLFSSIASFLGSAAQANYALANSFLDGLAYYRQEQGLSGQSINWGPWRDIGMAKDLTNRHKQHGFSALTPKQSLAILDHLLIHRTVQVGVMLADWPKISEQLLFCPSWLVDLVISREDRFDLLNQLATIPLEQRDAFIKKIVLNEVNKTLGLAIGQPLDENEGFFELGMDSLMTAELVKRINTIFPKINYDIALVFNYATILKLSNYIKSQLQLTSLPEKPASMTANADPTVDSIYKMDQDALVSALWSELNNEGKSS